MVVTFIPSLLRGITISELVSLGLWPPINIELPPPALNTSLPSCNNVSTNT